MKYISVARWAWWRWMLRRNFSDRRIGLFRNLPEVIPGRWGFFILGFEVGSRNPGDRIGVFFKRPGLWKW